MKVGLMTKGAPTHQKSNQYLGTGDRFRALQSRSFYTGSTSAWVPLGIGHTGWRRVSLKEGCNARCDGCLWVELAWPSRSRLGALRL